MHYKAQLLLNPGSGPGISLLFIGCGWIGIRHSAVAYTTRWSPGNRKLAAAPVVQPSGADQAAVTLGNADGEIGGLTISDPPTQAEVQALGDKCEELVDDVRNLSALIHSLRTALVAEGLIKGSA